MSRRQVFVLFWLLRGFFSHLGQMDNCKYGFQRKNQDFKCDIIMMCGYQRLKLINQV